MNRLSLLLILFLILSISFQSCKDLSISRARSFLDNHSELDSSFISKLKQLKIENGFISARYKNSVKVLTLTLEGDDKSGEIINISYDSLASDSNELVNFFKKYIYSDINQISLINNNNVEIGLDWIEGILISEGDSLTVMSDIHGNLLIEDLLHVDEESEEWAIKLNKVWFLYKVKGSFH